MNSAPNWQCWSRILGSWRFRLYGAWFPPIGVLYFPSGNKPIRLYLRWNTPWFMFTIKSISKWRYWYQFGVWLTRVLISFMFMNFSKKVSVRCTEYPRISCRHQWFQSNCYVTMLICWCPSPLNVNNVISGIRLNKVKKWISFMSESNAIDWNAVYNIWNNIIMKIYRALE